MRKPRLEAIEAPHHSPRYAHPNHRFAADFANPLFANSPLNLRLFDSFFLPGYVSSHIDHFSAADLGVGEVIEEPLKGELFR